MLDLKRRADHSLLPRSPPPVWLKLDTRLASRKMCPLARNESQQRERCWALPTRNDGQACGSAVGRQLRIFSRGAHAASRLWQAGFVQDALVEDAEHGCPSRAGSRYCIRRSCVFSSRATRNFYTLSPVLHGRAVQTASLGVLSSRRLPSKGDRPRHLCICLISSAQP